MALVPNGRRRVMRSQMFKFAQLDPSASGQQDAQPQPKPDPRLEVEQESMGNEQPTALPQADNSAPDGEMSAEMPGEEMPDAQSVDKPNAKDEEGGGESEIKDAWYSMLASIGVPARILDNLEKQLYSEQTDLASNTIKGHYMIPTYTQKGKVSKQEALQLARKMEQQFGLTSVMKLENRNWRIDFQTRPKVELQQGGTSFDELGKPQQKAASAMTLGEMLESRRNELFEAMRGFAGKGK
jgi:hypothetical protein